MKPVHIGCSGWSYKDWRGKLYPEGLAQSRWLERYSEVFDTVEVNNTFYRLPTEKAVRAWVEKTPDDFCFTIKASRYLTHIKRLRETKKYAKNFYEPLKPLMKTPKMGPVLWQFPPNFERDDERIDSALKVLPKGRHCFEFRHESWFTKDVYALLRKHDAALVIGDDPERPFTTREITASWTFVRLHRGERGRDGNYSYSELDTWARRIAAWRSRVEVFAYFNNDWSGYAPENAQYLKQRLS